MAIILDGSNGVTTPSVNSSSNLISTVVSSPTSLSLKTNGSTTAVTIDTSQNVGIGTTSPTQKIDVLGKIQIQQDSSSNNRIIFRGQPASTYRWNLDNYGSSNNLRIFRENDSDGSAGVVVGSFGTGGMFALQGGNITSGIGVAFPATQSASSDANTLDDYEEGTWSPTYSSGTGSGLVVSTSYAAYTKVGRAVTLNLDFTITTAGTAGGVLYINNLPFAGTTYSSTMAFRENNTSGWSAAANLSTTTQLQMARYDAATVITINNRFAGSMTYFV